jgi:putative transposase
MHRVVSSRFAAVMARLQKLHHPFRWLASSPEVIRLVVMGYRRYPLSLRNVEDMAFERGIDLCHAVRKWVGRFGSVFASEICRKQFHHMRQYTHWKRQGEKINAMLWSARLAAGSRL